MKHFEIFINKLNNLNYIYYNNLLKIINEELIKNNCEKCNKYIYFDTSIKNTKSFIKNDINFGDKYSENTSDLYEVLKSNDIEYIKKNH